MQQLDLSTLKQLSIHAGIAFIILVFSVMSGERLKLSDQSWIEPPKYEKEGWDPKIMRLFSLGQNASASDIFWMRALQDPSLTHVPKGFHPPMYFDLATATYFDESYFHVYYMGSTLLTIVRDDHEGALRLINLSKEFRKNKLPNYPKEFRENFWSSEWGLSLNEAYIYTFELEDLPNAAQAFRDAAALPGARPHIKKLAERMQTKEGEFFVGLRLINFMIKQNKDDPKALKELTQKRDSLFLAEFIYTTNKSFKEWLSGQKSYHKKLNLSQRDMSRFFKKYLKEKRLDGKDPFGQQLFMNDQGHVRTKSEMKSVFGVEIQ